MIVTPTVLVLGAGASYPYGLPLGLKLREILLAPVESANWAKRLISDGFSEDDIANFQSSFFLSQRESIDAFLQHRVEFSEIGKAAIASVLLGAEDHTKLFKAGDWYTYLLKEMNAPFDQMGDNKLSILTFNYDRSLEYFLHVSLKHSFGKKDDEVVSKVARIPIIHLYGSLGNLPFYGSKTVEYGNPGSTTMREVAKSIRIIHDEIPKNDPTFDIAWTLLREAKQVIFLGFSFAEENVRRLFPYTDTYIAKRLVGTACGLTNNQCGLVKKQFPGGNLELDMFHKCRAFLEEDCGLQIGYQRKKVIAR